MADVRVEDIMTRVVVTMVPATTVHDAARLLARNHISGAPVVEDGRVVGMISESDLVHSLMPPAPVDRGVSILDSLELIGRSRPHGIEHGETVGEVMTPVVVQVPVGSSIWKAASIMDRRGVKRLPVVDSEDYLVGILSRADLVKAMGRDDRQIVAAVTGAIGILGEETIEGLAVDAADGVVSLRGAADRKSTRDIAVELAARTPGVVEVIDRMTFRWDDTHAKPASRVPDPRENWQTTVGA